MKHYYPHCGMDMWVMTGVVLIVVAIVIGFVWFHMTYACAEYRTDTCTTTTCTRYTENVCIESETQTSPCRICVRYERRQGPTLPAEAP